MRALFYTGESDHSLEWREAPMPVIEQPTDAIVKPLAVAACDLDRGIAAGHSPFPGPFAFGHEFTGEVLEVGSAVTRVKPGDIVLASFQPSCGSCSHCIRGLSSGCHGVSTGDMYGLGVAGGGWSGAISDAIRVAWANTGLLRLPPGTNTQSIASASDNLADALRGIEGPLTRNPGASVLIAGRGSIPLYAVAWAQFFGASRVTFASKETFALEVAARLGADCLEVDRWPDRFRNHDVTVDCTGDADGLNALLRSTTAYGECTSSSIFFEGPVTIPMFNLNMKGIHYHTGRVNSASEMSHVLDLVQQGFDPDCIEPVYCAIEDAIPVLATAPMSRKVIMVRAA